MIYSNPNYLPKAPPPNAIPLGVRMSVYESERDADMQSIRGV